VTGTVEQIVLVRPHRRQELGKRVIDMDVACRARTASAVSRQKLIHMFADGFHEGLSGLQLERRSSPLRVVTMISGMRGDLK